MFFDCARREFSGRRLINTDEIYGLTRKREGRLRRTGGGRVEIVRINSRAHKRTRRLCGSTTAGRGRNSCCANRVKQNGKHSFLLQTCGFFIFIIIMKKKSVFSLILVSARGECIVLLALKRNV